MKRNKPHHLQKVGHYPHLVGPLRLCAFKAQTELVTTENIHKTLVAWMCKLPQPKKCHAKIKVWSWFTTWTGSTLLFLGCLHVIWTPNSPVKTWSLTLPKVHRPKFFLSSVEIKNGLLGSHCSPWDDDHGFHLKGLTRASSCLHFRKHLSKVEMNIIIFLNQSTVYLTCGSRLGELGCLWTVLIWAQTFPWGWAGLRWGCFRRNHRPTSADRERPRVPD